MQKKRFLFLFLYLLFNSMFAQKNVHGELKIGYWSYYPSNQMQTFLHPNGEIKLFQNVGSYISKDFTNNNGYYSITWQGSYSWHYVQFYIKSNYVGVYEYDGVYGQDDLYQKTYNFLPSSSKTINIEISSDASNVFYHINKAHDYYKNTFNYSGMDSQIKTILKYPNVNAAYRPDNKDIVFGSIDGVQWARYSDVIYHEYFHAVHHKINGSYPSRELTEGLADYFACTINNDPNYGENTTSYNFRQLRNNIVYVVSTDYYKMGQAVSGACWDIRDALGSNITDQLVFKAIQINPKPIYIPDFAINVKKADYELYNSSYQNIIVDAFADHGITVPIPEPPSISISGGLGDNPTLTFSGGGSNVDHYILKKEYDFGTGFNAHYVDPATSPYVDNNVQITRFGGDLVARYSAIAVDTYGYRSDYSNMVSTNGQSLWKESDLKSSKKTIAEYKLNQNFPNPFNPTTTIKYSIPNGVGSKHAFTVQLKVYDILGNEVATLVNEQKAAGNYTVNFDASELSSGIYFYKLIANNFIETKKMILLK